MSLDQLATTSGRIVEFIGILVLIVGAALAILAVGLRLARGRSFRDAYRELRADLGRAILLGLEFHPHPAELRAGARSERPLAVAEGTGV